VPLGGVENVRQGRARLLDPEGSAAREIAAEAQQELRHLGPVVELRLDPGEDAAAIPERALIARTTSGVTLGDQLDRAERAVHSLARGSDAVIVSLLGTQSIRQDADSGAESYGYAARDGSARVVFGP